MSELIDDLLSFSRIGRSSMNPVILDMNIMVDSIVSQLTTPENNHVQTRDLLKAYGDANLIRHIWNNLISNAIKYSSKKPVPEIVISSTMSDNMIIYSVKDNGVGFDMQYVNKLFGVFQRLHSENEFEGNGVGLAIVQRIVKKHGGRVWAEGEVGIGATFYFSLPANGA
jgi:light-regulated signal transduction histidine kinase (bacteriophytochrome)